MTLYVVKWTIDKYATHEHYSEILPKAHDSLDDAIEYMRDYDLKDLEFGHDLFDGSCHDEMTVDHRFRLVYGNEVYAYFSIHEVKVEWKGEGK